jgi:hypothetical protein
MLDREFRRPVCIDDAPQGKACAWCGKAAVYQLTAIGRRGNNEEGYYCGECAGRYVGALADLLTRVVTAESTAKRA